MILFSMVALAVILIAIGITLKAKARKETLGKFIQITGTAVLLLAAISNLFYLEADDEDPQLGYLKSQYTAAGKVVSELHQPSGPVLIISNGFNNNTKERYTQIIQQTIGKSLDLSQLQVTSISNTITENNGDESAAPVMKFIDTEDLLKQMRGAEECKLAIIDFPFNLGVYDLVPLIEHLDKHNIKLIFLRQRGPLPKQAKSMLEQNYALLFSVWKNNLKDDPDSISDFENAWKEQFSMIFKDNMSSANFKK